MDLKEKFEQAAKGDFFWIKKDLDALGMGAVVSIGRIFDIAARIADPRTLDTIQFTDEILHPPKTAASQDSAFRCHYTSST